MCGRYVLHGPLSRHDPVLPGDWDLQLASAIGGTGRYNIAPSQLAPVLRAGPAGSVDVVPLRWGLLPAWAREARPAFHTINARAETVASRPAFRAAWRAGRRCLVPASGWYEWTPGGHGRQPHYLTSPSLGNPLMFAGLWEPPPAVAGDGAGSYTILTTAAAPAIAHLHPRQPLVLDPSSWAAWLWTAAAEAGELLVSARCTYAHHPVDRAVNSPRNDHPRLVQPIAEGAG